MDSLNNHNIDTIAVFEKFCLDRLYIIFPDKGEHFYDIYPSVYIQWKKDGLYHFLKVNDEYNYKSYTSDDCFQIQFYLDNQLKIYDREMDKKLINTYTYSKRDTFVTSTSSCDISLVIYLKPSTFYYRIDDFVFEQYANIKDSEIDNLKLIEKWCIGTENQLNNIKFPLIETKINDRSKKKIKIFKKRK
jgi:hypothetical protein